MDLLAAELPQRGFVFKRSSPALARYFASIFFDPKNAQLGGVFLVRVLNCVDIWGTFVGRSTADTRAFALSQTLTMCLLSGFFPTVPDSGPPLQFFIHLSYARWLNAALWITGEPGSAFGSRLLHC